MAILTKRQPVAVAAQERTHAVANRAGWLDVATVTLACGIFFALCVYQLQLPGLYNDEAFDVIPAMQIVLGHPVELQRNVGIDLFGTTLPLMSSSDYQGITSTWLAIPFFAIGGVNVISLRMMTVLVGVLGVVLSYFLARAWFGRAEARLTVLMLAVSPAWVFWSRLGVYVVSEVVPIATGALLAFTYWLRNRPLGSRNGGLYAGMFLLGLGLTTKLLFLWFIVAVAVCALVLFGRRLWDSRRVWWREKWWWAWVGGICVVAFCAGAFPFLLYNLRTGGTFNLLRGSLSNLGATSHGVNNTAFVRNLWTEADSFKVVLDGGYFWFQGLAARVFSDPLAPALFAISALGLVASMLPRKSAPAGPARWEQIGIAVLALAAALSLVLALTNPLPSGALPKVAVPLAIAMGVLGIAALIVSSLKRGGSARATWTLFTLTALTGAAWWFCGAGRPETPAPGGPLGLWPVDAAGVLFWASGAALVLLLGWDKRLSRYARAALAALTLIGLIVAQSAVTISGLWSTHLIVLLPLPQMVIAAFVVVCYRKLAGLKRATRPTWRTRALRVLPAVLVVGSIAVADLIVDYNYHRDLAAGGGRSTFSDAIYGLSSYLESLPGHPQVVAMDWGFKRPIQFLTQESVNPIEAYGYSAQPTPEFYAGLRDLLKDPATIYLFHVDEETAYPRFDAFQQEAQAERKTVVLDKTFTIRDGTIVYRLYTAK